MYFWTQLNLCYLMWTKHRFEFWRHSYNMIALLIVTPVSTWISSIFSWLWLLRTICDGDENMLNESLKDAGIVNDCMATGLCNAVLERFNDRKYGFFSSPWQAGYSFFSILPFLTFLILNKPHDCYRCVGKDPERKYSKFQYSIIDQERSR